MSNQLEMVKRTRGNTKRLYTYEEISHLIAGDKRTIRKMAEACGAYHYINRATVYIDYPILEEFILSHKNR
ncbi:hypothetical protein D6855_14525 [Butyrivibrio sp. CB08]|uniref:hypothetical protein n=1 Tax=Butyrivibrio sp. CB08 TaxID=2364879 RepID=UPI000EA85EE0|nr:hypothetical protein [Butyrivibrio sp. CB08]RKM56876.1 hypothetical protein D6855_14525 [Butyrivibrio sp. CB08]